ncbi:MAG: CoB--CoM heterodisulfide reductase iron-sulfur subunit B family protein [Thermodesulfobacteriota bacterium]
MKAPLRYALFLGCTIPARSRNYEMSARKVAGQLGIELVDLDRFICCGFPIKSSDRETALVLAAYNLALAQQEGLDVCALCSSCASSLTETAHYLAENNEARLAVNKRLAKVGVQFEGDITVRHFARILYEDIGPEHIRPHLTKDLKGLRIANHYGCHYLKPSEIYDHFDDVDNPRSLDALVALAGAEPVDYLGKNRCCGGPVLPVDEQTALSVAKEKLDDISLARADAICLVCPFCSVMFDSNQKSIGAAFNKNYDLPVLYLSQVLGLAMGFDRKELGLNMNVVKTRKLLASYFDEE